MESMESGWARCLPRPPKTKVTTGDSMQLRLHCSSDLHRWNHIYSQ